MGIVLLDTMESSFREQGGCFLPNVKSAAPDLAGFGDQHAAVSSLLCIPLWSALHPTPPVWAQNWFALETDS